MQNRHLDIKPGEHPVSATSRPTITGSGNLVSDPTIKPADAPGRTTAKLEPLGGSEQSAESAVAVDSSPQSADLPNGVIDIPKVEVAPTADTAQDLIDKKTYHLPISSTPQKRVITVLAIIILVVIFVAAAVYFYLKP